MEDGDNVVSTLRSMIQHEDEQLHRRLSWLGTFQGFLFASLGFSWGENRFLTFIICLLGIAVALLIFSGVCATVLAMRRIRMLWLQHKPQRYNGPDIFGYFPERAPFTQFISPEMLLPIALATAWICVVTIR